SLFSRPRLYGFMSAFDRNPETAKKLEHDRCSSYRTDYVLGLKIELRAALYRPTGAICGFRSNAVTLWTPQDSFFHRREIRRQATRSTSEFASFADESAAPSARPLLSR